MKSMIGLCSFVVGSILLSACGGSEEAKSPSDRASTAPDLERQWRVQLRRLRRHAPHSGIRAQGRVRRELVRGVRLVRGCER